MMNFLLLTLSPPKKPAVPTGFTKHSFHLRKGMTLSTMVTGQNSRKWSHPSTERIKVDIPLNHLNSLTKYNNYLDCRHLDHQRLKYFLAIITIPLMLQVFLTMVLTVCSSIKFRPFVEMNGRQMM
ncbi:hypothetical protein BDF21DRAFT_474310 [Thamnidium elegans]|nr:hypothetical protein BDF21DRAFT_474310 [Thamnidium elegans]